MTFSFEKADETEGVAKKDNFFNKVSSCPLCNEKNGINRFTLKQLIWDVETKECSSCGILYKLYMPNDRLLHYIYSSSYVHFNNKEDSRGEAGGDIFASRVQRLGKRKVHACRHLDYGCGAGGFVKSSINAGWDSFGCDPFLPDNINDPLISGRLYKLNVEDDSSIELLGMFDVISMWAVAEHLTDPLTTFKALTKLLKPEGKLIFNWPNGKSTIAKRKGENWSMALLLEHLTFITPKGVDWLAKELNLSIEKMVYCGSPYPVGLIKKPDLENQGIEKLPFTTSQDNLIQNKIATVSSTKNSLIKKIFALLRSVVLSNNGKGFIANSSRVIINTLKLGDHVEVVFIKNKHLL